MNEQKQSKNKVSLLDLGVTDTPVHLSEQLSKWGVKPFRVKQILRQVFQRGTLDFALMTDLPKDLREQLAGTYELYPVCLSGESISRDGTTKYLWRAGDGSAAESVVIPMQRGHKTVCLSTQTGCALGCSFCATGRLGAGRNLTAGEILIQAIHPVSNGQGGETRDNDAGNSDRSPNYVFMGMGEPLLNYENLAAAIRVMNHIDFMQVGARRITVSTVGLPEQMVRFSTEFPQVKLALSLHTADDSLRRKLMPIANKVPLPELIDACLECNRITGRRITLEYLVLPGINDRDADVSALARISDRLSCKINLIGYNPVSGLPYRKPSQTELIRFRDKLLDVSKKAVTLRQSHGSDIAGACGQLAGDRHRG
ncbi:MAG: 23S rRNA (adenine(2503)-C(2))-methyltransferase RlmN [Candidatus Glassbacteria bacterium]|nr:23S rRNA (adenine(2503)-C(2))-methyltransferase RlmN [Candidatus Glassbacteria bacterium]